MKINEIMQTVNDGTRSLFESAMAPALVDALKDWQKANTNSVLIGGMGLSYHVRPRMTQDLDFLFLSDTDIPDRIPNFKRTRAHAFQHNQTHVEVEIITPNFVNVPEKIFKNVMNTAVESDGIKIASGAGLTALKLFRLSMQDKADIVALIKSGNIKGLAKFGLSADKIAAYNELVEIAKTDQHPS